MFELSLTSVGVDSRFDQNYMLSWTITGADSRMGVC